MWITTLKHKLGQLYWSIIKQKDGLVYKIMKYFKSLYIWVCGIGKTNEQLERRCDVTTLIICAHPDDETIFFFRTIKKECPFIVCMSHIGNRIRREEFQKALDVQNVIGGIMLNFPDVPGLKWVWKRFIPCKLRKIRKFFPNIKTIYTHSGYGESGHPHHFYVHDGVVRVFDNCRIYSTAATFHPKEEGRLDAAELEEKNYIISNLYSTQANMLIRWCGWFDDYLHYEVYDEVK